MTGCAFYFKRAERINCGADVVVTGCVHSTGAELIHSVPDEVVTGCVHWSKGAELIYSVPDEMVMGCVHWCKGVRLIVMTVPGALAVLAACGGFFFYALGDVCLVFRTALSEIRSCCRGRFRRMNRFLTRQMALQTCCRGIGYMRCRLEHLTIRSSKGEKQAPTDCQSSKRERQAAPRSRSGPRGHSELNRWTVSQVSIGTWRAWWRDREVVTPSGRRPESRTVQEKFKSVVGAFPWSHFGFSVVSSFSGPGWSCVVAGCSLVASVALAGSLAGFRCVWLLLTGWPWRVPSSCLLSLFSPSFRGSKVPTQELCSDARCFLNDNRTARHGQLYWRAAFLCSRQVPQACV